MSNELIQKVAAHLENNRFDGLEKRKLSRAENWRKTDDGKIAFDMERHNPLRELPSPPKSGKRLPQFIEQQKTYYFDPDEELFSSDLNDESFEYDPSFLANTLIERYELAGSLFNEEVPDDLSEKLLQRFNPSEDNIDDFLDNNPLLEQMRDVVKETLMDYIRDNAPSESRFDNVPEFLEDMDDKLTEKVLYTLKSNLKVELMKLQIEELDES